MVLSIILLLNLGFSAQANSEDKSKEIDVIYSKLINVLPEGSELVALPYVEELSVYGRKAKGKLDKKSDAIGGKAYVVKAKKGKNPWDAGVNNVLFKSVKKGDVLHFTFFAKAVKLPKGQDSIELKSVGVQKSSEPYNTLFGNDVTLNETWQSFTFAGTADRDYDAQELQASFQVATDTQTIAFGPLLIFNVGNGVDISTLPYVK